MQGLEGRLRQSRRRGRGVRPRWTGRMSCGRAPERASRPSSGGGRFLHRGSRWLQRRESWYPPACPAHACARSTDVGSGRARGLKVRRQRRTRQSPDALRFQPPQRILSSMDRTRLAPDPREAMHWTRCAVLVIAMLGVTRVGEAQEPAPCTFDRCGLVVATPMTVLAAPIDTGPPRTIWWYFVPHIPELD